MKNKFYLGVIALSINAVAQQAPTNNSPSGNASGISSQQFWSRAGNNNQVGQNNIFGTLWNSEVYHYTGGTLKFTTTVNNGLTSQAPGYNFNTAVNTGDGISIAAGAGSDSRARIDLFTSGSNQTHIRMDGTALLQTRAVRFENIANLNGFWYNATGNGANDVNGAFTPQFIWNIQGNERGRLGSNGFWHLGNSAINANNTLEIQSSALSPYGNTGSGLRFTNLNSANNTIANGINGVNNTKVLSVDQNGDVVLVDGGVVNGNNGISVTGSGIAQLGVDCSSPLSAKIANRLTTNRMIHMNGFNMIFADGGRVNIGGNLNNCTVGNKLEITSGSGMPYFSQVAINGSSGLRLTFLTSSKTPITNGTNGVDNTKVLSVDQNGDVVLVDAGGTTIANNGLQVSNTGNVQLGGDCTNPIEISNAKFLSNRVVAMNSHNIIWTEGKTGFGTGGCTPGNRVEIQGFSAAETGLRFTNVNSTIIPVTNPGQGVLSVDANGDVVYVNGGFGAPCSSATPYQLPTDWKVDLNNHSLNFNGLGNVNIGDLNGCQTASPGLARLFVRNTYNNLNIPQVGIYSANWGTASTGNYAIETNGDINVNGVGYYSSGILVASDKNIKQNIDKISSSLGIIEKLQPVKFEYNNSYAPQLNTATGTQYGFIAQEVEQIVPELVKQIKVHGRIDSTGTAIDSTATLKSLNYIGLIPFAIGGIQELNAKQREMQAQLDKAGLSDAQVKTNINNFNALAKIKTLNPVQYNFTNQNVPQLSFNSNVDYGFVAQQLQNTYPELIDTVNVAAT